MSHGTYYSQGHYTSGILMRKQAKLNHKCIAEGSITSVDKGVQLVAKAEVKQDTILFRVMLYITTQHKTTIGARGRGIIDTEDPASSHAFTAAANHALVIADDLADSDLDPSMGDDKTRVDRALHVGDDVFGSPIKGFGPPATPSGLLDSTEAIFRYYCICVAINLCAQLHLSFAGFVVSAHIIYV